MKFFYVKTITNGVFKSIMIKANSLDELIVNLDNNVDLVKATEVPSFFFEIRNIFSPKGTILELIEFIKNLSLMLNSGLTFSEIIEDMKEEQKSKAIQQLLVDIQKALDDGETLSDVLRRTIWIPEMVPNMVTIGEQNGKLANALEKCYKYLEKNYYLKKNMIQAMIYPAISMTFVLFSFMFWLLYVLPKMIEFFKSMNLKVPAITQTMFEFSNWLKSSYFIPLFFIFLMGVVVYVFLKRPKILAPIIDSITLKIPLIGKIIQYYNTAFIAESLSLYVSSGFGIFEAIKSLRENTKNDIYKNALEKTMKEVVDGKSLFEAFRDTKVFPTYFVRMLKAAEKSGSLDQQMKYVSDKYFKEIEDIAANIQKIISPFIMTFVGWFIIVILMVFIGPIYDSFTTFMK